MTIEFSIQVPIRGEQFYYTSFIDSIIKINMNNFELIICNDYKGYKPLTPIKTDFPQKIIVIKDRPEGWGYPCARNVCLDNCTVGASYLVHIDVDWHLFPNSLSNIKNSLSSNKIVHGFKYYATGPKSKDKRLYEELCIFPLDAVLKCKGWDEIFFPNYAGYWRDVLRRIKMVRPMKEINDERLIALDTCKMITHERLSVADDIVNKLKRDNTFYPIKRNLFLSEKVFECGY